MQKHERDVLLACRALIARQEWPIKLIVSAQSKRSPKKRLTAVGPNGKRYKMISSSPKNCSDEVNWAIRWLKRVSAEII